MIKIDLEQVSKRYRSDRLFRNMNATFEQPNAYALLGANGSGKSTLLRTIAGMQAPSAGKVRYSMGGKPMEQAAVFEYISFAAPGQEIVEELTLTEFLDFHFSFKHPQAGLDVTKIIDIIGLNQAANKTLGDYSSGMKQRVKLAQAIFSDTPALLLDEPCTNLDQAGVEQYRDWIENYGKGRLILIASNDIREYYFCKEVIELENHK